MIPQSNLSRLANRLAKAGGRRIPESVLERDYCLSWFLGGLSQSPVRDRLIFKGGTALKKCYFPDYRFSEDLDYSAIHAPKGKALMAEMSLAGQEAKNLLLEQGPFEIVLQRYEERDPHPHDGGDRVGHAVRRSR